MAPTTVTFQSQEEYEAIMEAAKIVRNNTEHGTDSKSNTPSKRKRTPEKEETGGTVVLVPVHAGAAAGAGTGVGTAAGAAAGAGSSVGQKRRGRPPKAKTSLHFSSMDTEAEEKKTLVKTAPAALASVLNTSRVNRDKYQPLIDELEVRLSEFKKALFIDMEGGPHSRPKGAAPSAFPIWNSYTKNWVSSEEVKEDTAAALEACKSMHEVITDIENSINDWDTMENNDKVSLMSALYPKRFIQLSEEGLDEIVLYGSPTFYDPSDGTVALNFSTKSGELSNHTETVSINQLKKWDFSDIEEK